MQVVEHEQICKLNPELEHDSGAPGEDEAGAEAGDAAAGAMLKSAGGMFAEMIADAPKATKSAQAHADTLALWKDKYATAKGDLQTTKAEAAEQVATWKARAVKQKEVT